MYVIIVGAGRTGIPLAKWLISGGHEIGIIEKQNDAYDSVSNNLGSVSVFGDGTDKNILSKAGTNRADVLIATTRSDDVNLVTCQLAKYYFQVEKTIAILNDQDNRELFDDLGIDVVVNIADLLVSEIQEGLASRETRHLMPFSELGSTSLLSVRIPGNVGIEQRKISELTLPDETLLPLIIKRDGNMVIPDENTSIESGDQVIVVTAPQTEDDVRDILTARNGEH